MSPWERGILCVTAGITAAVLMKLCWSRLVGTYKLLFAYLVGDLFSTIASLTVPFDSNLYAYAYFSSQTLKIAIAAFVLVEIYTLALEEAPALSRFGRNIVSYILAAAALVPVAAVLTDHTRSRHPYLRAYFLFEQTMDGTMAIFLIIISMFMAWFPVRMRRNVIVYIWGFIVWSLSRSAMVRIVNQWSGNKRVDIAANLVEMAVVLGCLLLWLLGLRREGEVRTAVVGHLWNRAEAERLSKQLKTINQSLERLRRK